MKSKVSYLVYVLEGCFDSMEDAEIFAEAYQEDGACTLIKKEEFNAD